MSQLQTAWEELTAELAATAPASYTAIRPSRHQLDRLRGEFGADVAEGLREWFDLHDGADWNQGSGDILPFCLLLGMEDSIGQSQLIRQIWTEQEDPSHISAAMAQPAGEIAATWLPAYVMIGDDTCGGGLFIDLRDGERKGCIRFWDKTEADDGAIETSSLTELISGVTDSIRNRTPICQHVATVVDGRINWEFDE